MEVGVGVGVGVGQEEEGEGGWRGMRGRCLRV